MTIPRIVFSDAAVADILEQFDWYAERVGRNLAKRWEASVTTTLLKIAGRPATGSLCQFSPQELRETRRMCVARFPKHLIFYEVREREILVLRVVHGARDLESLFSADESSDS